MPLSIVEKNVLVADATKFAADVNALVIDPAVNPLQAALDAANAAIVTQDAMITQLTAAKAALQDKLTQILQIAGS